MVRSYCSTGKWILAGEHSVLRGSRALVFPLPAMQMKLDYQSSSCDLMAHFQGPTGENYQLLFYGLVDRALEILGRPRRELKGSLILESNLPLGNGLGASAALCVVVGRWLVDMDVVDASKLEPFCRELENLFHGESSGVDVAVVLSGQPLCFSRFAASEKLVVTWKPQLYLSSSGQKGLTHSCVQKVKEFIAQNPVRAQQLDAQMSRAVEVIRTVLASPSGDTHESRQVLQGAMFEARRCFEVWGLTEGAVDREMRLLEDAGALAVKPTGSGGGGYVLSLWEQDPPAELRSKLVPCW